MKNSFEDIITKLKDNCAAPTSLIIKKFNIGNINELKAAIIYSNSLSDKTSINRDILSPLMLNIREDIALSKDLITDIMDKYVPISNTKITNNIENAANELKRGKCILIVENQKQILIFDTSKTNYRAIEEPVISPSISGAKESFVESLEANQAIVKRRLKNKNLVFESFVVGSRSETDVTMFYLSDVTSEKFVESVRDRLSKIDVDMVSSIGDLQQLMEIAPYNLFPQQYITDSTEKAIAKVSEGRVGIILEGSPYALSTPAVFLEFFQTVDDYNQRTIVASFARLLRFLAIFVIITGASLYLSLIKFNCELLREEFVAPIVRSRQGIPLSPFIEILLMEIVVEFLREGGLRLPSKIGQTLSIIGGIIIGDTAVKSHFVSPTTLLVIGVSVVATFLIPNYQMALALRLIRFPMLILTNFLGAFGIAVGWYVLILHLLSMKNLGIDYLELNKHDLKDLFIRYPIWMFNKRPKTLNTKDTTRQTNYRGVFRRFFSGKDNYNSK